MRVGMVLIFASAEMEDSFKFFASVLSCSSKICNDKKCNGCLNKFYDLMNLYLYSDRFITYSFARIVVNFVNLFVFSFDEDNM